MHILILNYEYPPLGGGAGNAAYYLLRELALCHSGLDPESRKEKEELGSRLRGNDNRKSFQDDIKITLVTSSVDKYKEEQFSDNIKIYYLDIGKKGRNLHYQSSKDLLSYAWAAYRFCKWLKKREQIDLVHAIQGYPAGYLAMKIGLPYIVSLRGTDVPFYNKRFHRLDKYVFKRLSGKIWSRADKVVANSEGLKQLAQKSYPEQDIAIIPNGVDVDIFKPAETKNEPFTVLSVSRLIQRKGLEYLIDGFADFNRKYPDSKLVLAGSGNMRAELGKRAEMADVTKNLSFLGAVSKAEIPHIYRQSDVFALPSLAEGMSNAVLEAMASGLAILTTNVGGTAELIGKNGFIIEKGSSKAIFDALEKLYLNRKLLSLMKISSRLKAEQMSWTNMAAQYKQIYKSIQRKQIKVHSGNFQSNLLFLDKTKLVNKTLRILEIGSGSGALVRHFMDKELNIIGADVRNDFIDFAKDKFNVEIVKLENEKLPFASESFDIVLSFDVFEHIANSDYHLQEVKRVLKKDGYYLFGTPNKWLNALFETVRVRSFSEWKRYHCSLHNYWDIQKRLKDNNFSVVFENIPIMNDFAKNQIREQFGKGGVFLSKLINLDRLPMFLKTNFFIKAKVIK